MRRAWAKERPAHSKGNSVATCRQCGGLRSAEGFVVRVGAFEPVDEVQHDNGDAERNEHDGDREAPGNHLEIFEHVEALLCDIQPMLEASGEEQWIGFGGRSPGYSELGPCCLWL